MQGITKVCLICAAIAVISAPDTARADGYVTPWIGSNLVGTTGDGHDAFGLTTGYMGAGVFGFEADFGYSPDFSGSNHAFDAGTFITVMGNFILGVPIGGTHDAGVRPFVSGGLGLMRSHIGEGTIANESRSNYEFGYDLGGGMMGFFNQHIGLRGEARYLRVLQDMNRQAGVDFDSGKLRYWRVSAGVTFR